MPPKARAISIRADRAYILAVNTLAEREGAKTADFVRQAIDVYCGDKLTPLVSFFADDGKKSSQPTVKTTRKARAKS